MENKNLFDQLIQSNLMTKIVLATVVLIWTIVFVMLIAGTTLILERPSEALEATAVTGTPSIWLSPAAASAGSTVTVYGDGWTPGSTVLFYLLGPAAPDYAVSSAGVDPSGQFTAELVFPSDPRWSTQATVQILAQVEDGSLSAQTILTLVNTPASSTPASEATDTATAVIETATASPTDTSTPVIQTATQTPQPEPAQLVAVTNLNVRSGPGVNYAALGSLSSGQTAVVTGLSYDRGWWQIKFRRVWLGFGPICQPPKCSQRAVGPGRQSTTRPKRYFPTDGHPGSRSHYGLAG